MKRHIVFRLLARLKVGRKLLLIYLLDLSAVVFISGILIHEKYLSIDFSNKEILGSAYVAMVRDALIDVSLASTGHGVAPEKLARTADALADAQDRYGARMESAHLNENLRLALIGLNPAPQPGQPPIDRAVDASRALITRIGNQSNLILDPDLDSYYAMSLSILRYPALLDALHGIGKLLAGGDATIRSRDDARARYLLLEGQLDAVLQGLRSDFSEGRAANRDLGRAIGSGMDSLLEAIDGYRLAARAALDGGDVALARNAQRDVVASVRDVWLTTGDYLDTLLHSRVRALYSRMWLHLGTALFLLFCILGMVYFVAQQISRPLRHLARVMDRVRRTGDHTQRASWDSQDEIGQLVRGFNEMLGQLDRERDVQKELAATARAAAAQQSLVEATPVPMMVTAVPGHEVLHANQPALAWLGGRTVDPWMHGMESAVRARFFQQLSDHDAVDEFEVLWKAGAEPTWAMLSARRLQFQGRDAVLTAFTPINQIKLMEQRLELWAKVFEASSEAILILDADRTLLSANASFYRSTGFSTADVVGKTPDFIVADNASEPLLKDLTVNLERASTWSGEAQVRRRQGGDFPAWLMVNAVRDKGAVVSHYICTVIDITDRKKSEARIRFLAEHDVLTQLPNRALFTKELGRALDDGPRTERRCAVLFIDLDRFKDINDSLGHHIGDGLLKSVSRRLLQAVRGRDTVSRLGGDEFTVILADVGTRADVEQLISDRLIPLVREPHEIGGVTLQVSCSVGVAMYPDDGVDIDTLMQNADAAMYQAKAGGRNQFKFFSPDMAERARMRLAIEAGLRTAVEHRELSLVFQPCIDATTGTTVGAEALLRWTNPQLGSVPPARFIPIAEETRLIIPIGTWVIEETCRHLAAWRDQGMGNLRISINLSAIQLREPELLETLRASLAEHEIAGEWLELEITETVLMGQAESYLDAIHALRSLGVRLSLDDFGTGYSSLSYLNRFPLDRLKIDKTFVRDMIDAPADIAVVKAIIELGHELGLRVVAEGVESEQEATTLRRIGCDQLQGYLYGRPMPGSQLPAWVAAREREPVWATA
ncbi:sensor domain-containing diguanylate cyclase [Bordetella genomosp. 8]|uniref:Sensor domain-containing diguanylate cyclase n=1 Tax=Bordetella genomosp. 8 TaxID=1416806 RepID=A0A1W6YP05_9BORD|nr:EAL domain-containing protein [Bordetella genomosp. 8]ARP82836.1 sensor domain-containing diguanylate cyclase [Bordetella genomosp. 8]